MKGFVLGFLVALVLFLLVPLVVFGLGLMNVAATSGGWPMEETLAPIVRDLSVARRAPDVQNPKAGDQAAVRAGMSEYFEDCILCHPSPGLGETEYADALYPPAPRLDLAATQDRTDGEIFWIVKNGLKMTGMPAFGPEHSDEEIWEIVAFVRELPGAVGQGEETEEDVEDEEES